MKNILPLLVALLSLFSLACVVAVGNRTRVEESPAQPSVTRALCLLAPTQGHAVRGTVTFLQQDGAVLVRAEITGLTPGAHGFHVHEFGDCSAPDAASAGGHFNPMGHQHAGPDAPARHMGDLGNLVAGEDGVARMERLDKILKLGGPHSIVGRAVIVHEKVDDLATQPTGNAGGRVACGVIGAGKAP
jgi:Cu-Zn family superoxide dismutase